MKIKQLPVPDRTSGLSAVQAARIAQRRKRQEIEELKVQVLEVAEHEMEITVNVLRHWISDKSKK